MNDILYTTSLKSGWKAVLNLSALFIMIACLDIVLDYFFGINIFSGNVKQDAEIWTVGVLGLAMIGAIISIVYSYFYKVEVTETGFRKKGIFGSFTINYDDIEEVFCDRGIVSFKSEGKAISLGSLYSNFDEVTDFVEGKIKERTDINFTGKEKRIEKYFPWALED